MNTFFKSTLLACILAVSQVAATSPHVIDFLTKRDLELVDSVNQTHLGVAATLDRTKTKAGAALLREMLVAPTTDRTLILQRQQAIKTLVEDPALLIRIEKLLSHIAQHEQFIAFFDPANAPVALTAVVESFRYNSYFLAGWNDSSLALDVRHVLQSFSPLITAVFEFAVLHFALEYLTGTGHKEEHGHGHMHGHAHGHKHEHKHSHEKPCCLHHAQAPEDASMVIKTLVTLAKAGHIALHLVSIKDMAEFISAKMAVMNQLYQALQSLHAAVTAIGQAQEALIGASSLDRVIAGDALAMVKPLFNNAYFETNLDENNGLGMGSLVGKTLVTYAAVQKNKIALDQLKNNIALLDTYSSLARVMLDAKNSSARFCFAEFVAETKPRLEITNGWHPMLNPEQVVTNSFTASEVTGEKYVLSGPNRSGKSSFLRMSGVNVGLAQVFGIAAADRLVLTMFHKILSFMTITDDLATGQSSAVARMMRADECIALQSALSADEFALVLLDDSVGQGTAVKRGEEIACTFIQQMGSFDNNIVLAATHFDAVKNIGNQPGGRFKNMRMRVVKDASGNASGAYILEPGISDAQDVGILIDAQ